MIAVLNTKISDCTTTDDKHRMLTLKREVLKQICEDDDEYRIGLYLASYDFRGVNLSDLNLSKVDLRGTDLRETNMEGANLTQAALSDAKLENIHWKNTNLTNIEIDFDNISFLPLSAEEQYEKLIECLPQSKKAVNENEIAAIKQFRESLNVNNKLQARLSKLDDTQLQVLLPCLYVEAAHKLNPIIAYNTKDTGYKSNDKDDNVAMLQGYASLLSTLNNILDPNKKHSFEEKVEHTLAGIEKLVTLLIGRDDIYREDKKSYFKK